MNYVCYSQESISKIDSATVAFKAKLFTVSKYGISPKDSVLSFIENQKLIFLKTSYKNFIFMKIEFSQPYKLSNGSETILLGKCNYYLAYNISASKYYRLGGFDNVDIDDFFNALNAKVSSIYVDDKRMTNVEYEYIEEIDIFCLARYYKLSKKQRLKTKYCLGNCNDEISDHIDIP